MKTSAKLFLSTIALLLAVVVLTSPADAQKKKKDQAAPPAQQQTTEQASAAAPQPAPKPSSSFRDYLMQYQGMPTNLGKLVKIGGDYFVVEDEGIQSAHRIDVIHTLKLLKAEEGEPARLEIKLLSRD